MSYYMMNQPAALAPLPPAPLGAFRGFGQDNGGRVATDIEGRYAETSWGMVAAVGAGALLMGVFLGYVAGKRAQKRTTANYRRNAAARGRRFEVSGSKVKRKRLPARRKPKPKAAGARRPVTAVCLIANPRWSTKYKNQLPDSAFFYVAPGGRKVRTTRGTFTIPKSKRKLPYKNLSGRVDRGHLLAAIGRAGQKKTQIPAAEKKRIQGRAQRMYGRDFGYKTAPTRALPRAA